MAYENSFIDHRAGKINAGFDQAVLADECLV
ncbi:hypothetical protein NITLEN_20321 [Nitrospira lenta]|uniref:Uncharacterized protein n=1 Tax=Nitrospira lenta TaxID=1436998 RepID=A0A330L4H0_9BACT|nr:hypothetical protein NITLEN_20321 [Nitrospira lenta]